MASLYSVCAVHASAVHHSDELRMSLNYKTINELKLREQMGYKIAI